MNFTAKLLISLFMVAGPSCHPDELEIAPFPNNLFVIDSIMDIGNNDDASDILVESTYLTSFPLTSVRELRLFLVKSTKQFGVSQILAIQAGNYYAVPLLNQEKLMIKPPSTLKDTDGDAIVGGILYKAFLGAVGEGTNMLLSQPKEINLNSKSKYAGKYLGTWEDLGPPGPGSFTISLIINDDNTGALFYSDKYLPYGRGAAKEDAKIQLSVTGNNFIFKMNQYIGQYTGGGHFGINGGCPNEANLTGTIVQDINLIFDVFNWSDCDGSRNVKMKFTKQ